MRGEVRDWHGDERGKDRGRRGHGGEHRHRAIYVTIGGGETLRDEANEFTSKNASRDQRLRTDPHQRPLPPAHRAEALRPRGHPGYPEIDFMNYAGSGRRQAQAADH
jgi:hypothetical protein